MQNNNKVDDKQLTDEQIAKYKGLYVANEIKWSLEFDGWNKENFRPPQRFLVCASTIFTKSRMIGLVLHEKLFLVTMM